MRGPRFYEDRTLKPSKEAHHLRLHLHLHDLPIVKSVENSAILLRGECQLIEAMNFKRL